MSRRRTPAYAAHAQPPAGHSSFLAPLSPHWAFVVQLREGTPLTAAALQGRVEHIVSGQQAYFNSLAELRTSMEQTLTDLQLRRGEKPP